jgi:hypothetical protein
VVKLARTSPARSTFADWTPGTPSAAESRASLRAVHAALDGRLDPVAVGVVATRRRTPFVNAPEALKLEPVGKPLTGFVG